MGYDGFGDRVVERDNKSVRYIAVAGWSGKVTVERLTVGEKLGLDERGWGFMREKLLWSAGF